VDFRLLRKIFGLLFMVFSISMLPPFLISLQDGHRDQNAFMITFVIVFILGLLLFYPQRHYEKELRNRDSFIVVTLFWVIFSLLGAIPFMLSDYEPLSFTDATFESMSGFTTTGATVMKGLDYFPQSLLFYRQELQWLGGMGIIVLAVAILPVLGIGGMQLFKAEAPGPIKDAKLTPRIIGTAKALYVIYLVITILCALVYKLLGMEWFDAIAHSLSTVANGGFSTHDASYAWFDSPALEVAAIFFMTLSGVNFALHYSAWNSRSLKSYWQDTEFRAYIAILVVASLLISTLLAIHDGYEMTLTDLHHGSFQLVSFMTTSGFGVAEFASWPTFIPVLLVFSGFIGGCAGSTAGGIKVIRIVLLAKQGLREIKQLVHPNALLHIKLGKVKVEERVTSAVWGFFGLYVLSFTILMLLVMAAGVDQITAFSAIAACINNVGPGLGRVASNFIEMNDFVKWIGIFAMLLGRLEIFTVLVLFSPTFWQD
jgi:trk system potassium uptake protein TrkH